MEINKLSGIAEHPSKADKSAVGAINRPLRTFQASTGASFLLDIRSHSNIQFDLEI